MNNLIAGSLSLVPLFEQISVYASFSGDDNQSGNAYVEWRPTGESRWRRGVDLVPDRRANLVEFNEAGADIVSPNPYRNQFRGIIFGADGGGPQGKWLRENHNYDVRVTFVDPDGVTGSPITRSVVTLNSQVASSGPVKPANPSNFATVLTSTVAGDIIELQPGTYSGGVTIIASGQPNNYITIRSADMNNKAKIRGGAQGLLLMGSYIRAKGLDLSDQTGDPGPCIGVGWDSGLAVGNIIEQCVLADPGTEWGSACVLLRRSARTLIQDNVMATSASWSRGQRYGVFFWECGAWGQNVIRRNIIITNGTFRDGIGGSGNFQIEAGPGADSQIYNNTIEGPYDDGVESEGGNMNCAIFGNVIKNTTPSNEDSMVNGIAMASVVVGPLYVVKNIINQAREGTFKQGSSSWGTILLYHNSSYLTHYGAFSSGNNRIAENQVARNNIYVMAGGRVIANYNTTPGNNDYDFDNLFDSIAFKAFWYSDPASYNSLAALQAINRNIINAFGQVVASVERHAISANPQLVAPDADDFHLQASSPCIDVGEVIPGINTPDSPWSYSGSGPDLGAIEYDNGGETTMQVTFTGTVSAQSVSGETVTLTVTKPGGGTEIVTALTTAQLTFTAIYNGTAGSDYSVVASIAEDADYLAASSPSVAFSVGKSPRTITVSVA